jgi:hypothetical protein
MIRPIALAVLLLLSTQVFAGDTPAKSPASQGFDKLKTLTGTWKGATEEGKKLSLTYKVVSAGSTVMETNNSDMHKDGMITMFHVDGDRLMMTHYCSIGNQPRMVAAPLAPDGKLVFTFLDGTNMTPEDTHMHALTIVFHGKDRITEEWTLRAGGKDQIHAMELTRATKSK